MPNLIEQQDLLKSLPDQRLMTLLQRPMGDIPPFLVAAEAQRRQEIRKQFGGETPKTSVVDDLTRQVAKVPQNIKPPMNPPPMMQQTPQTGMAGAAGIAAIPQGPQPQMPKKMAAGGVVGSVGNRVQEIADQFGVSTEEAAQMLQNNPDLSGTKPESEYGTSSVDIPDPKPTPEEIQSYRDSFQSGIRTIQDYGKKGLGWAIDNIALPGASMSGLGSWALGLDSKSVDAARTEDDKKAAAAGAIPDSGRRLTVTPYKPDKKSDYQQEEKKPPKEQEDELRKQLAALYSDQDISDWEKAAKWFAASEQFLDPSKTTMQSLAGAGRAFAESAGQAEKDKRANKFDAKKALLEYDIGQRDWRQKQAAEAAQKERDRSTMSAEAYANTLGRRLDAIDRIIGDKQKAIADAAEMPGMDTSAIQAEIEALNAQRQQIAGMLASLGEQAYGPVKFETFSLADGFKR